MIKSITLKSTNENETTYPLLVGVQPIFVADFLGLQNATLCRHDSIRFIDPKRRHILAETRPQPQKFVGTWHSEHGCKLRAVHERRVAVLWMEGGHNVDGGGIFIPPASLPMVTTSPGSSTPDADAGAARLLVAD